MTMRCWLPLGVLFLCLCGTAVTQSSAQENSGVPPKEIRVTLLGTASGPRVHLGKAGISTLVEAGGERLLFDAGRGFMQRLVEAGYPMNAVTKLFLTHLHSDHVLDVPDLMLTPWSAPPERKVPLEVWGPDGTRDMMRHLEEAFAFDIHMRRDVDESFSPEGIRMVAHDIREGKVYERNGVTVTAFLVTHGLVKPSVRVPSRLRRALGGPLGRHESKRQPGRPLQGRGRVDPRGDRSGRAAKRSPKPAT